MPGTSRTLVLFENERVCSEALIYAREYCLRMDHEVALLMLVDEPPQDRSSLGSRRNTMTTICARAGKLLNSLTTEFLKHGIAVSVAVRIGEPARELMRFLSERPPFQVAVWGSDTALPPPGEHSHGTH